VGIPIRFNGGQSKRKNVLVVPHPLRHDARLEFEKGVVVDVNGQQAHELLAQHRDLERVRPSDPDYRRRQNLTVSPVIQDVPTSIPLGSQLDHDNVVLRALREVTVANDYNSPTVKTFAHTGEKFTISRVSAQHYMNHLPGFFEIVENDK
jgi:hypothetical protein